MKYLYLEKLNSIVVHEGNKYKVIEFTSLNLGNTQTVKAIRFFKDVVQTVEYLATITSETIYYDVFMDVKVNYDEMTIENIIYIGERQPSKEIRCPAYSSSFMVKDLKHISDNSSKSVEKLSNFSNITMGLFYYNLFKNLW